MLTLYSWTFTSAKNDPEKAYIYGWGSILLVSIYCVIHTILSVIATVNHILDKAAFVQRYTQELEDKIKLTILKLFYKKGAAEKNGFIP